MRPLAKRATPAAIAALRQATRLWPKRRRSSDGLLPSAAHVAQNPNSDHNDGYAFDLSHSPEHGVDCNVLFRRWRDDPRVEYLIWDRKIWSKSRGERAYTGPNPHTSHIHVSIKRDGLAHLNTKTWFYWVLARPTRAAKVKAALQRPKRKKEVPSERP